MRRNNFRRGGKPKTKKRAISNGADSINPSSQVIEYKGPLRVPREISGLDIYTTELIVSAFLTSTVGGVIANVFSADPTGDVDWANFSGNYVEYRVLAVTVEYIANILDATIAGLAYAPIYIVSDRQLATPIASYGTAAGYRDVIKSPLNRNWTKTARMADVDTSGFSSTGGAPGAGLNYIKVFATGLTVSTTYGNTILRHLVQFRGRA